MRKFTEDEMEIIRKYYPDCYFSEYANLLPDWDNRQVNRKAKKMGLVKTEVFREKHRAWFNSVRSTDYIFHKGDVPFNKGLKVEDYMTPEAIEKMKAGWFVHGHASTKKKPIGSRRRRADNGFWIVKTENGWEYEHRAVWEKSHGEKIKPGEVVFFKDGNPNNLNPDNLCKITRQELWAEHTIAHYPREVHRMILALSRLKKIINDKNETK